MIEKFQPCDSSVNRLLTIEKLNNMKIGILTYPLNNNYGCYLQSYALLHFLQGKGYDVEYVYRRHDKPAWYFYLWYACKTIFGNICNLKWQTPFYDYEWNYMEKNGENLIPFFERYIVPHTKPVYTTKGLKKLCIKYDVVIVGSDQVWRAGILSNIEDYFLCFLGNRKIRRIAYAASFGKRNPDFCLRQIRRCGEAVRKFHAVSVREEIGLEIISDFKWECKKCQVVLDPTMLLPCFEYTSFVKKDWTKRIVLGYILDQTIEKDNVLKRTARTLNLEADNFLEGQDNQDFCYPPIEMWLTKFYHARFVVTDSFHGAVFSILFNKPFAILINNKRGAARFETLLKTFCLEDRVVSDTNTLEKILSSSIDWFFVNETLKKRQEDSIKFLLENIENNGMDV